MSSVQLDAVRYVVGIQQLSQQKYIVGYIVPSKKLLQLKKVHDNE